MAASNFKYFIYCQGSRESIWLQSCCRKASSVALLSQNRNSFGKRKHRTNFLLQLHLLMQPLAADMPGKESSYETSLNKINKNIILHDFYAVQRLNYFSFILIYFFKSCSQFWISSQRSFVKLDHFYVRYLREYVTIETKGLHFFSWTSISCTHHMIIFHKGGSLLLTGLPVWNSPDL